MDEFMDLSLESALVGTKLQGIKRLANCDFDQVMYRGGAANDCLAEFNAHFSVQVVSLPDEVHSRHFLFIGSSDFAAPVCFDVLKTTTFGRDRIAMLVQTKDHDDISIYDIRAMDDDTVCAFSVDPEYLLQAMSRRVVDNFKRMRRDVPVIVFKVGGIHRFLVDLALRTQLPLPERALHSSRRVFLVAHHNETWRPAYPLLPIKGKNHACAEERGGKILYFHLVEVTGVSDDDVRQGTPKNAGVIAFESVGHLMDIIGNAMDTRAIDDKAYVHGFFKPAVFLDSAMLQDAMDLPRVAFESMFHIPQDLNTQECVYFAIGTEDALRRDSATFSHCRYVMINESHSPQPYCICILDATSRLLHGRDRGVVRLDKRFENLLATWAKSGDGILLRNLRRDVLETPVCGSLFPAMLRDSLNVSMTMRTGVAFFVVFLSGSDGYQFLQTPTLRARGLYRYKGLELLWVCACSDDTGRMSISVGEVLCRIKDLRVKSNPLGLRVVVSKKINAPKLFKLDWPPGFISELNGTSVPFAQVNSHINSNGVCFCLSTSISSALLYHTPLPLELWMEKICPASINQDFVSGNYFVIAYAMSHTDLGICNKLLAITRRIFLSCAGFKYSLELFLVSEKTQRVEMDGCLVSGGYLFVLDQTDYEKLSTFSTHKTCAKGSLQTTRKNEIPQAEILHAMVPYEMRRLEMNVGRQLAPVLRILSADFEAALRFVLRDASVAMISGAMEIQPSALFFTGLEASAATRHFILMDVDPVQFKHFDAEFDSGRVKQLTDISTCAYTREVMKLSNSDAHNSISFAFVCTKTHLNTFEFLQYTSSPTLKALGLSFDTEAHYKRFIALFLSPGRLTREPASIKALGVPLPLWRQFILPSALTHDVHSVRLLLDSAKTSDDFDKLKREFKLPDNISDMLPDFLQRIADVVSTGGAAIGDYFGPDALVGPETAAYWLDVSGMPDLADGLRILLAKPPGIAHLKFPCFNKINMPLDYHGFYSENDIFHLTASMPDGSGIRNELLRAFRVAWVHYTQARPLPAVGRVVAVDPVALKMLLGEKPAQQWQTHECFEEVRIRFAYTYIYLYCIAPVRGAQSRPGTAFSFVPVVFSTEDKLPGKRARSTHCVGPLDSRACEIHGNQYHVLSVIRALAEDDPESANGNWILALHNNLIGSTHHMTFERYQKTGLSVVTRQIPSVAAVFLHGHLAHFGMRVYFKTATLAQFLGLARFYPVLKKSLDDALISLQDVDIKNSAELPAPTHNACSYTQLPLHYKSFVSAARPFLHMWFSAVIDDHTNVAEVPRWAYAVVTQMATRNARTEAKKKSSSLPQDFWTGRFELLTAVEALLLDDPAMVIGCLEKDAQERPLLDDAKSYTVLSHLATLQFLLRTYDIQFDLRTYFFAVSIVAQVNSGSLTHSEAINRFRNDLVWGSFALEDYDTKKKVDLGSLLSDVFKTVAIDPRYSAEHAALVSSLSLVSIATDFKTCDYLIDKVVHTLPFNTRQFIS